MATNIDNPSDNINTELLEEFVTNNFHIITNIIEEQLGKTTLKSAQQYVPLSVKGRDVKDLRSILSRSPAVNINEVKGLIDQAINLQLTRDNVAEQNKLIFTQKGNPEEIRSETITWQLIQRKVGTTSQGKQMNERRHNYRPLLREIVYDPDVPNKKLYVYGQWFDNVIELCCWARSNEVADKRALWLEQLMQDYAWFFLYKGVSKMRYEGRMTDFEVDIGKTEGNKLYGRPLRYYIRTERISHLSTYTLADVLINTRVTTDAID